MVGVMVVGGMRRLLWVDPVLTKVSATDNGVQTRWGEIGKVRLVNVGGPTVEINGSPSPKPVVFTLLLYVWFFFGSLLFL